MKSGRYWYAMQDPSGTPTGYARLRIDALPTGAHRVRWDLHLAFPGGRYEEERSSSFSADGTLLAVGYRDAEREVEARREGRRMVGVVRTAAGEESLALEVEDDAVAGMGFVLATTLPRVEGEARDHADYNEARGLAPEGRCTFLVGGREDLLLPEGRVAAWRVTLRRADGRDLPLWVDEAGRLLQADWGGGHLMVLHPDSTEALFQPDVEEA